MARRTRSPPGGWQMGGALDMRTRRDLSEERSVKIAPPTRRARVSGAVAPVPKASGDSGHAAWSQRTNLRRTHRPRGGEGGPPSVRFFHQPRAPVISRKGRPSPRTLGNGENRAGGGGDKAVRALPSLSLSDLACSKAATPPAREQRLIVLPPPPSSPPPLCLVPPHRRGGRGGRFATTRCVGTDGVPAGNFRCGTSRLLSFFRLGPSAFSFPWLLPWVSRNFWGEKRAHKTLLENKSEKRQDWDTGERKRQEAG